MDEAKYVPLLGLIEPHFDKPYDQLPDEIKARVDEAFFVVSWDSTPAESRKLRAVWVDVQADPTMEAENEYWFSLWCEIEQVQQKIAEWEGMHHQGIPSEARLKEEKLAELHATLTRLDEQMKSPAPRDVVRPSGAVSTGSGDRDFAGEDGLLKRERQIRAIEATVKKLGYNPVSIPTGGKTEVKRECKATFKELFGAGDDPFLDAWKEAVKTERVRMADHRRFRGQ